MQEAGFFVHPRFRFLGASPDGLVRLPSGAGQRRCHCLCVRRRAEGAVDACPWFTRAAVPGLGAAPGAACTASGGRRCAAGDDVCTVHAPLSLIQPHRNAPSFPHLHTHVRPSPDPAGDAEGSRHGLLEIKCPLRGLHRTVPPHYMAQMQGQMAIIDRPFCDFVSLCAWRRSVPYPPRLHVDGDCCRLSVLRVSLLRERRWFCALQPRRRLFMS